MGGEMTDESIKLPPLPEWSKRDDLGGLVPSEIRAELQRYAREAVRLNVAELRAEVEALRTLLNTYNLGGWTDALGPMKRALAAEAEVERLLENQTKCGEVMHAQLARIAELERAAGEPIGMVKGWHRSTEFGPHGYSIKLDVDEYGKWQPELGLIYARPQPAIPEGWQLVPKEPTKEMLCCVDGEADDPYVARGRAYSAYRSMLAAAPQPAQPEAECSHAWIYYDPLDDKGTSGTPYRQCRYCRVIEPKEKP
jgi:hypothetical protein